MRAPKYQPNQVRPSGVTDARHRAANNNGGVAGGIADGLQEIGGAVREYAITQDRIDEQNDDTQSRLISAEAGKEYDLAVVEYGQLRNGAAREANPAFQERLNKIKSDAMERAPTDRAKRMLEQRLSPVHNSSSTRITGHALKEAQSERKIGFLTQRDSYAERAAATDDPVERERLLDSALAVGDDYLTEIEGLDEETSPEAFDLARLEVSSKVHGLVVEKMLAEANPSVDGVVGYLRAYGDEMTPEANAAALRAIKSPLQNRSARSGASKVLGLITGAPSVEQPEGEFTYSMPTKGSIPKGGTFHSSRDGGGRQHRALDVSAAEGTPIYTTAPGTVTKVVPMDGASGNWVEVTHPDGRTSTYSHMKGFSVKKGDNVAAGAQLGEVGSTGAGTGPHLHWVVRDENGNRIDPETVLGEQGTGSFGSEARDWDRAQVMASLNQVAEAEGWNPEEKERVRIEVMRQVNQEEGLLREKHRDAADQATRIIAGLPNGLENINQIPQAVRSQMDETDVARLEQGINQRRRAEAEARRGEAESAARTRANLTLKIMERMEPERFKSLDLTQFMGVLSPEQFTNYFLKQQDIGEPPKGGFQPQGRIGGAISRGQRFHGIEVDDADLPAIYDYMEDRLKGVFDKNGDITLSDADDAFKAATSSSVTIKKRIMGLNYSDDNPANFEIGYDQIPDKTRDTIIRNWQGVGKPTKADVLEIFRQLSD